MPTEPSVFAPKPEHDGLFHVTQMPTTATVLHTEAGRIIFHADGRLELEGFGSLDAAAQAFWEAVQRWKPLEWQVTLPWQQERA